MIIRRAAPQDCDDLCMLIDQVDALHRNNQPEVFRKPIGPVRDREYVLALIADDNVGLFVAEVDGALGGMIHAFVRDTPDIPVLVPRRFVMIDNMVVREDWRGRGLGRALITTVHQWAIEKGATSVELNVYDFNQQARDFYESMGYEVVRHSMSRPLEDDAAQ